MKHKLYKTKQSWLRHGHAHLCSNVSCKVIWQVTRTLRISGRGEAKFSFNSAPGFSFFPLVFSPLYEIPGAISLILGCVASVLCSNRGVGVYLAYLHCFQDSYIAPIFLCTSQSSGEKACIQSKYHKQNPSKNWGESTFKTVLGNHEKGSFLYIPLGLVVHESAGTSNSIFVVGLEIGSSHEYGLT